MIRKKYKFITFVMIAAVSVLCLTACKEENPSATEAPQEEEFVLETIEEQVLFDEKGVKVIANEIMYSENYGKGISLTFVNNTMKALTFDCKKMIINGIMAPDLFGERVQPGQTLDTGAYFGTGMLDYLDIDNVAEIKFQFDCYDTEGYNSVYKSDLISVKTSEYENMDSEVDFDGKKVYEDNGITIYGKMASDELFNQAILFYVENSTDKEFLFKANGVTIDGEFNEYPYYFTMCENSNKLYYLEFIEEEESEGEAGTNEEIQYIGDEFEMDFEIYDRADVSLVDTTGSLKLKMK